MRSYLVDDIPEDKLTALAASLDARGLAASLPGLYWLPLPDELLTPLQREHAAECGPHVMALELLDGAVKLEFLVRARGRLRCDCVGYADPGVRDRMIASLDSLLLDAGIAG